MSSFLEQYQTLRDYIRLNQYIPDFFPDHLEVVDDHINVYTDGSYKERERMLGIGVIIPTTDPNKNVTYWKTIIPDEDLDLHEFGALTAEFTAATFALHKLKAGSNVRLHTDHPILRQVINRYLDGKPMLWKPRRIKEHKPEFVKLVTELKEAMERHDSIEVVRANDIISQRMELAHQAAAKGSGASGRSKVSRPDWEGPPEP